MTDLNVDRRYEEDAVSGNKGEMAERERKREREAATKIESTGRGMKVACVLSETLAIRGIS